MTEIGQVRHFIYCHVYVYIGHSITCGVNDIDLCRSPHQKIHKTPYFGVLGERPNVHYKPSIIIITIIKKNNNNNNNNSRTLNSAPIESQCMTSY